MKVWTGQRGKAEDHAQLLKRRYGKDMHTFLDFSTPMAASAATILSAQSQDAQVNKATKLNSSRDHPRCRSLCKDYAPTALQIRWKRLAFTRERAKTSVNSAKIIVRRLRLRGPEAALTNLVTLPGVGRKTANVVLANAHKITRA